MLTDPHDLLAELPEYSDQIRSLQERDETFNALVVEYNQLDHHIHETELSGTPIDDHHFENLKKQRLRLKDELVRRVRTP